VTLSRWRPIAGSVAAAPGAPSLFYRLAVVVLLAWAPVGAIVGAYSAADSPQALLARAGSEIPEVGFSVVRFDVGVVAPNGSTEHSAAIVNESQDQCSVKAISSDCGCIVHQMKSVVVAPGASWDLKFRYAAPDGSGVISKRIVVVFNEPGMLPLLVHVQGIVRNWAEPSSDEIAFGDVIPGGVVEQELAVVTTKSDQGLGREPVVSGVPWVTVRLMDAEKVRIAGDDSYGTRRRYQLVFAPPAEAPPMAHQGEFVLNAAESDLKMRVRCRARVVSKIRASADEVFFGVVEPGAHKKCVVRLHPHDERLVLQATDFSLRHDLGPEFTATVSAADTPGEWLITMELSRAKNNQTGIRTGNLRVAAPQGTTLDLPVRAWFE